MVEAGRQPKMPEVPLPYLIEYLFEVGPAQGGGLGPVPISHTELLAWQQNMRRMLAPWEIAMLRRLSMVWIDEARKAEASDCPPPWGTEEVSDEERRRVANSLRDSMRKLAR